MSKIRLLKRSLLISVYINLVLSVSLFSQTDSLGSYIQIAEQNNPVLLQRLAEYQAALQKIPQVGALPDPTLTAGLLLKRMMLVMGYQVADIKLMQMFPWFGTLKYAKDEMSQMARAKFESFLEAKYQVFFDVQSTWYDLYRLNQDLRISRKNLEILRTIERLSLVRFRTAEGSGGSGTVSQPASNVSNMQSQSSGNSGSSMEGMNNRPATTQSGGAGSTIQMQGNSMGRSRGIAGLPDLYRIQIEISQIENNIELTKNQLNTVTAKFNTFLNRPVQTAVAVPDTLMQDSLDLSLNNIPDTIGKNNPALAMIKYEQNSLESREKMIRRMGYPMLGAGVDYSILSKLGAANFPDNGMDMIMPMVSLTLPVYRKKYKSMLSEAETLRQAKAQNYTAASNNLQAEYYQAVQLYQDAARRIKLYSYQYLLADRSLDIMIRSYSAAAASLTDILTVRQQTYDYELKKAEAVTDFNTAVAWLKRLMATSII